MARGTVSAFSLIGKFKPDAVLLTGGFVGVPVALAARLRNVPSVVYLPDIEPGQALKLMTRFCTKVATTTEASARYIAANKMVVTGYPVRAAFAAQTRESARAQLDLPAGENVLLVFGGSKGAQSINRAIISGILSCSGTPSSCRSPARPAGTKCRPRTLRCRSHCALAGGSISICMKRWRLR